MTISSKSISIMTSYGLDYWGTGVLFPSWAKKGFPPPATSPRPDLGPPNHLSGGFRVTYPGVRRLGRELLTSI